MSRIIFAEKAWEDYLFCNARDIMTIKCIIYFSV